MLQNFTRVNNFPPQVSSCNPSVVSYMCACCCCLFLCRMLCLLFLFFCLGLFVQKKVTKLGSEWKKKHLGWSFVKKRRPETVFFAENSFFLKKGEPPKPRKGTAIFSGRTAKIQHIGFCGGLATAKIHTSTAKTQPLNRQNSDLGPPKLKWLRRQPPNLLCSIVRNFFDKFNSGFENLWCVIKRSTEHTRKFTYAKYYSYVVGLM